MRFRSLAAAFALSVVALAGVGCRRDRAQSPAERIAMLQSPDAGERRDAADDLMDDDGPPPQAVPYLIAALQREQDSKTYGVMLLALGKSGAPEAKPYIEANLQNPNKGVRERAEKALELWSRRNPYGTPVGPPMMGPPMMGPPPGEGTPMEAPPGNGPPQLPPSKAPPAQTAPPAGGETI